MVIDKDKLGYLAGKNFSDIDKFCFYLQNGETLFEKKLESDSVVFVTVTNYLDLETQ
jgi:hypothetical protein